MTRRPSPADDGQKVAVTGALIQSGRADDRHCMGRVLLTFDPAHRDDLIFLSWAAAEVSRLSRAEPVTPDERAVVDAVGEGFLPGEERWREMPPRLMRGVRVHLVDIWLDDNLVPVGYDLADPDGHLFLPCRADPRCRGMAELLPCTAASFERSEDVPAHRLAANGAVCRTAVRVQANRLLYGP